MIRKFDDVFKLDTRNTTYLIRVSKFNHILNDYYGRKILDESFDFSKEKYNAPSGTAVNYSEEDFNYVLDTLSLEISSPYKGDYKEPSLIVDNSRDFILDLVYLDYEIKDELTKLETLPSIKGKGEELIIHLKDKVLDIYVDLHYYVIEEDDVIGRNIVIKNKCKNDITLLKAMSMQLEMVGKNFSIVSLYGGWGFEGQKSEVKLDHNILINDSKTGNSSNRHNPFFLLKEEGANYNYGDVYAFNMIYSSSHYEMVEHSAFNKVRIQQGISPSCFKYTLKEDDVFETPISVMTYSCNGVNGVRHHMHDFVRHHILKEEHKDVNAPLLINNWEATYMDFKESQLHSIIKEAKKLGLEMFVLDDGWFGRRKDDLRGLGDYDVNKKKLHKGLEGLQSYAEKNNLRFGLWFEPEMVNEDSKLYEEHPSWVIRSEIREPSKGRHQLVLDLSLKEVQDYIIENVNKVLDSCPIGYVKWDMNRHMSDVSSSIYHGGEIAHRYIVGLYRVFENIINKHQNVYFEGCASGGNRFDLGILSYFDQIWTSDDTDAYERINIQSGYSLAYPLRCLSNHVSDAPSHSVLRKTPIQTRFNVAFFGSLGFELDLKTLTKVEKNELKNEIEFYKEHRELVRDGDFYELKDIKKDDYALWLVVSKDKKEAVLGYFNSLQKMNPSIDEIKLVGLNKDSKYSFEVVHQEHDLHLFGGLINQVLPFRVNPHGALVNTVAKYKTMPCEKESYVISGAALEGGALKLNPQWMGTGFNDGVRALGDFGSRLYYIKEVE